MERLKIDNSIIAQFAKCPASAMAQYREHRTSGDSLIPDLGTIGHEALEAHFNGADVETVDAIFAALYEARVAGVTIEKPELKFENLSTIIHEWVIANPLESMPFEVVDTERNIVIDGRDHGFDFDYSVKRDALIKLKLTGQLAPLDHKFRFGLINDFWSRKFKSCSQFTGYIWVTRVHDGMPTCNKNFVNAISFGKLPNSNRKCKVHDMTYAECGRYHISSELVAYFRTEADIEAWKRDLPQLVNEYRRCLDLDLSLVPRFGKFNDGCTFCNVSNWCNANFDEDLRDELTTEHVWQPWKESNAN